MYALYNNIKEAYLFEKVICMLLSFIALISVSCSTVHGPSVPTPNAASPAPLQTPYSAAGQSNIRIDTPETLPPKSPSKTAMPATIDMLQQLISKAESYAGAGDYANAIDTFTLILSRLEDCSLNTLALTCDAYIGIADAYEKLYGYEKALDILADGILEIYSSLGADASYDLRVRWLEIRLRHAEMSRSRQSITKGLSVVSHISCRAKLRFSQKRH